MVGAWKLTSGLAVIGRRSANERRKRTSQVEPGRAGSAPRIVYSTTRPNDSAAIDSPRMHSDDAQAGVNWRAIAVFYVLACAFSWPFFWWRDVHTVSWKAFPLPEEIKDLTWGPAVAALLVFWFMPATRRWAVSFFGSSRLRSAVFFVAPILCAFVGYRIHAGVFSYKLLYYLMIGSLSTLGEELGWRGFLQGALRPLGRIRGYLLVALMWEAWHFTSHLKGTLSEVVSRMSIYIPLVIAVTFLLGLVVERTDSLLLAVTLHEWLDITVDSSGTYLMWAALACIPLWIWLLWTWPGQASIQPDT